MRGFMNNTHGAGLSIAGLAKRGVSEGAFVPVDVENSFPAQRGETSAAAEGS
jgi:hypothetical protein